jgi:hypothetical protein
MRREEGGKRKKERGAEQGKPWIASSMEGVCGERRQIGQT